MSARAPTRKRGNGVAKILLLEDDPFLGKALIVQLETAGHEVIWQSTIVQARASEAIDKFDLFIFDVNLPDGSGLEFCDEVRKKGSKLPIIMLTARTDDDSEVNGFESGANDYIKKPFSNKALLARIQMLLREPFLKEDKIRVGPVLVLVDQRKVIVDGNDLNLNRREFDIFARLAKTPGIVLSREQLLDSMDGEDILDRAVDSHFSHIRTKLKKLGIDSVSIRSVYGVGYTLEVA
jgi:DNA-binding response OmpR family regulator